MKDLAKLQARHLGPNALNNQNIDTDYLSAWSPTSLFRLLPFVQRRILFDGQNSINVRPRGEKDGPSDLGEISADPMILSPKQTSKWPSFLAEPTVCQSHQRGSSKH